MQDVLANVIGPRLNILDARNLSQVTKKLNTDRGLAATVKHKTPALLEAVSILDRGDHENFAYEWPAADSEFNIEVIKNLARLNKSRGVVSVDFEGSVDTIYQIMSELLKNGTIVELNSYSREEDQDAAIMIMSEPDVYPEDHFETFVLKNFQQANHGLNNPEFFKRFGLIAIPTVFTRHQYLDDVRNWVRTYDLDVISLINSGLTMITHDSNSRRNDSISSYLRVLERMVPKYDPGIGYLKITKRVPLNWINRHKKDPKAGAAYIQEQVLKYGVFPDPAHTKEKLFTDINEILARAYELGKIREVIGYMDNVAMKFFIKLLWRQHDPEAEVPPSGIPVLDALIETPIEYNVCYDPALGELYLRYDMFNNSPMNYIRQSVGVDPVLAYQKSRKATYYKYLDAVSVLYPQRPKSYLAIYEDKIWLVKDGSSYWITSKAFVPEHQMHVDYSVDAFKHNLRGVTREIFAKDQVTFALPEGAKFYKPKNIKEYILETYGVEITGILD